VRLGGAGLVHARTGAALDAETLTEWLASAASCPTCASIAKVDVARVAEVMSATYAERRRALPVQVGATEAVVATCEPLDTGWLPEIEAHTRKANPAGGGEPAGDPALHDRVLHAVALGARAQKSGERCRAGELRAAGRARQGQQGSSTPTTRASCRSSTGCGSTRSTSAPPTSTSSRGREMGAIRFRIDGVLHTVYQVPLAVDERDDQRAQAARPHGRRRAAAPADGRIKTRRPGPRRRGPGRRSRCGLCHLLDGLRREAGDAASSTPTPRSRPSPGWASASRRRALESWSRAPHGIFLVTGPPARGKTTTLYAR
jgi:general secretion pathway protein E